MPPRAATSGSPQAAITSWPWWVWPERPAPKRPAALAVVVRAEDREGVAVEVEAEAERFARGWSRGGRPRGGALRDDPEAVVAVAAPAGLSRSSPSQRIPTVDVRVRRRCGRRCARLRPARRRRRRSRRSFCAWVLSISKLQARVADAVVEGLAGRGLGGDKAQVPALGASVDGVPVALGGAGGPPAGVGAPPVAIAAAAAATTD